MEDSRKKLLKQAILFNFRCHKIKEFDDSIYEAIYQSLHNTCIKFLKNKNKKDTKPMQDFKESTNNYDFKEIIDNTKFKKILCNAQVIYATCNSETFDEFIKNDLKNHKFTPIVHLKNDILSRKKELNKSVSVIDKLPLISLTSEQRNEIINAKKSIVDNNKNYDNFIIELLHTVCSKINDKVEYFSLNYINKTILKTNDLEQLIKEITEYSKHIRILSNLKLSYISMPTKELEKTSNELDRLKLLCVNIKNELDLEQKKSKQVIEHSKNDIKITKHTNEDNNNNRDKYIDKNRDKHNSNIKNINNKKNRSKTDKSKLKDIKNDTILKPSKTSNKNLKNKKTILESKNKNIIISEKKSRINIIQPYFKNDKKKYLRKGIVARINYFGKLQKKFDNSNNKEKAIINELDNKHWNIYKFKNTKHKVGFVKEQALIYDGWSATDELKNLRKDINIPKNIEKYSVKYKGKKYISVTETPEKLTTKYNTNCPATDSALYIIAERAEEIAKQTGDNSYKIGFIDDTNADDAINLAKVLMMRNICPIFSFRSNISPTKLELFRKVEIYRNNKFVMSKNKGYPLVDSIKNKLKNNQYKN